MLLDEDPSKLITECIHNFSIQQDRASLTRITESLSTLSSSRNLRLSTETSALKRLSRTHASLQQQHELSLSSAGTTEHAQAILDMDRRKFRVAKEASELEIEAERTESEVRVLEKQLELLKANKANGTQDAGSDTEEMNVLKLKLYRSLGIELEPKEGEDRWTRAVVRSVDRGDVSIVRFEEDVPVRAQAERIWQAL